MIGARAKDQVPYHLFLQSEADSEQRHEWVDGAVYAMSRGSPEHARLTNRVAAKVLASFLDDGCESFSADAAIFIEAAQHHTCADGSLVCGPLVTRTVRDRNGQSIGEAITNPIVIVEVLSPTTERYDRDGKFEAYAKLPSCQQYVLVSQDERRIEVRTRGKHEWTVEVGTIGESVQIHGRSFDVDPIYA